MEEYTIDQLLPLINKHDTEIIYLYTTMCGTCQLAQKMLDIVEMSIEELSVRKCNVNYIGEWSAKWEIESVPCLIIFKNGELKEKIYAFNSVDYLFKLIKDNL